GATPGSEGPVLDVPVELTLPAANGGAVDLAALRGRVVLVDLMATWSMASQSELPALEHLLGAYAERGLAIVSVAMDAQTPLLVRTYVETLRIRWPVALATAEVLAGQSALGPVREIPRTLILDRRGFVRFDRTGTIPLGDLARAIEPLL